METSFSIRVAIFISVVFPVFTAPLLLWHHQPGRQKIWSESADGIRNVDFIETTAYGWPFVFYETNESTNQEYVNREFNFLSFLAILVITLMATVVFGFACNFKLIQFGRKDVVNNESG